MEQKTNTSNEREPLMQKADDSDGESESLLLTVLEKEVDSADEQSEQLLQKVEDSDQESEFFFQKINNPDVKSLHKNESDSDNDPLFKKDKHSDAKSDWLKHRRRSYIVYLITYFIFGFEVSLTDATLWIYVITIMQVKNKIMYFGIVSAIEYIPLIAFSALVSNYADENRRISFWMIFLNALTMIGNIVYTLPLSAYIAIFGRFLVGFSRLLRPLIVGEIARSYEREDVSRKIPLCTVVYNVGKAAGPLVAIGLTKVDFWIGSLHLTYGNISGAALFAVVGILQVFIIFFHYDVSREYDLKAAEENRMKEVYEASADESRDNTATTACQVFCNIITRGDTLLILTITFFSTLWDRVSKQVIPILVTDTLQYDINVANICFVAYAVVTGLILFAITWFNVNKFLYHYGLISLFATVINYVCLKLISDHFKFSINMVLLVIHSLFLSIGEIGEDIFLVVTFTKLISGKHQCFGEGVRDTVSRIASVIGAGISAYLYYTIDTSFIFVLLTLGLLILCLLLRNKSLRNPQIIIW